MKVFVVINEYLNHDGEQCVDIKEVYDNLEKANNLVKDLYEEDKDWMCDFHRESFEDYIEENYIENNSEGLLNSYIAGSEAWSSNWIEIHEVK